MVFWANKRSRRTRLENYLKAKQDKSPDEPFSVARLMADLGMTEAEKFAASFASRHIARGVRRDQATGFAVEVLFRYQDDPEDRASDEIVYQGGLRDRDEHAQFRRNVNDQSAMRLRLNRHRASVWTSATLPARALALSGQSGHQPAGNPRGICRK